MHTVPLATTTLAAIVLSMSMAGAAHAQQVSGAWVRGTVAGQKSSGAFMRITVTEPTTLLGADSSIAGIVELHEMKMEGNVMKMRAVERIDIKPGAPLELKPGGYHVMLMDLRQDLKPGAQVPITLRFKSQGAAEKLVELKAEVRALAAKP